jgi:hypothetical protein
MKKRDQALAEQEAELTRHKQAYLAVSKQNGEHTE